MRLIDADVLKYHIDKLPALPDGNFAGSHSALKALINMQPTVQPEEAIPVSWIESEIAEMKSAGEASSYILAELIGAMVRKWREEQHD